MRGYVTVPSDGQRSQLGTISAIVTNCFMVGCSVVVVLRVLVVVGIEVESVDGCIVGIEDGKFVSAIETSSSIFSIVLDNEGIDVGMLVGD